MKEFEIEAVDHGNTEEVWSTLDGKGVEILYWSYNVTRDGADLIFFL